ncbi:MAG: Glu-tRNA(Gln) amidotransferase subunit GatD [Candidatus Micrarchaeota archaeon]|nr:Glu-tRNA(Gln) amidotransferase subunit GatD [Candidatus Micrarchaeota archaeon]
MPIRPPQPKGCGFIRADANVAKATLRPLSKGQLGGQSCVNSALPPKVKTMSFRAELTHEIAILGCGGTIVSKIEYKTGAVFPAIDPEEIKTAFPKIETLAKITTKQIFSLLSEDMNSSHWSIAGKAVMDKIREGVEGVVLMHGTDTMHYSSAAMSFMIQNLPIPVIFVGSQRSSDRPSSDNETNLLNAVYAAKQNFAEVAICMHANTNDDYCNLIRGVNARKLHTSKRDAFKSVNSPPLAKVNYISNTFESLTDMKKREKRTPKTDFKFNDNVAMIYVHPNIQPKFISKLSSFDGIVLMGTGLGHVPTNPFGDRNASPVIKEVKELINSDIPVVMTPQTIFGRVNMNVYTAGRLLKEAGVIGDGCDWTPETAFVKLSWILGHTKKIAKVKEEMLTNMIGEISERSIVVD